MDFVSNMWSKTGLKGSPAEEDGESATKESGEEQEIAEGAAENTDKNESSTASGTVGFVSNMFKSTFKSDDRKSSVISTDGDKKEEGQTTSFVTNLLSKNPFKSSDKSEEGKERKASQTSVGSNALEADGEEGVAGEGEGGEPVSQKAMDSAKTFGNFLYSVANKAGQTVSSTAKNIKHSVETNTMFGDFTKEQQDFMKEHGGNIEVGEPPWKGCENEDEVREQIISLSQDKRNFVRSPPGGVQFDFDLQSSLPIALSILKEDDKLNKMRFEIVPKLVNEETFWRNYFYRVSLLKQSTQANNLKGCKGWASTSSSEAEGPDEMSPTSENPEFVSDSIQGDISADDLKKGMRQLGVSKTDSKTDDDKNWEDEITKDLQEFEVVGGMTADGCEEAELERDLAAL